MNPAAARCEHDESFVADVPWRDVYDSAHQLLATAPSATPPT
jgi:hypothetical protein